MKKTSNISNNNKNLMTKTGLLIPSPLSLDFQNNELPKLDSSFFWVTSNINAYRSE